MTIGTIFTLFVVPSFYMLLAKQHSAVRADAVGPATFKAMEPESVAVCQVLGSQVPQMA